MANNENKQTTPAPAADPKDDLIAQLQAKLETEQAKNKEKDAQLADANAKAAEAEKALADLQAKNKKLVVGSRPDKDPATVTIKLYKDQNIKDDVQVFVNGRQYIIKRGVSVDVPREVFEVLQNQEKMRDHIAAYNEQHEQK